MKGKKSFTAYCDWIDTFEELSNEEAGKLIKHIFRYVNDQEPEAPDRVTKLIFAPIRATLKRDLQKWIGQVEVNRKNGKSGGRPKKANQTEQNPKKPNGFLENRNNPKKGDRDSVRDRDSVSVKDKERDREAPPYSDFLDYALDVGHKRSLNLDETKLQLKYDSWVENKWRTGKGARIVNWKSTLLNTLPYLQKEKNSAKKERFRLSREDLSLDSLSDKKI